MNMHMHMYMHMYMHIDINLLGFVCVIVSFNAIVCPGMFL